MSAPVVVRYELFHGADGYYMQWHCPICKSSMSSGDWMALDAAMAECTDGAAKHLKDFHRREMTIPTKEVTR